MSLQDEPLALYQRLKNHVQDAIASGTWAAGTRVPSESELVRDFTVSRMTANRALRELAAEGILTRVPGVGTFVAEARTQFEVVSIRNIADEIRQRGNVYSNKIVSIETEGANVVVARSFSCDIGSRVFRSVIVHYENETAIQIEDRFVNPAVVPDYLTIDFTNMTPNEYLMRVAPLSEVRHVIEAVMPDQTMRDLLGIGSKEPCLRLFRETWSRGRVGTCAWLTHPGSRYRMVAAFTPPRSAPLLQSVDGGGNSNDQSAPSISVGRKTSGPRSARSVKPAVR